MAYTVISCHSLRNREKIGSYVAIPIDIIVPMASVRSAYQDGNVKANKPISTAFAEESAEEASRDVLQKVTAVIFILGTRQLPGCLNSFAHDRKAVLSTDDVTILQTSAASGYPNPLLSAGALPGSASIRKQVTKKTVLNFGGFAGPRVCA